MMRSSTSATVTVPGDSTVPSASTAAQQPTVSVSGLRKMFRRRDGETVPAVDSISLDVKSGEFVVLLGPSGCGKSTLLRCIAGLEQPDSGVIKLHGRTSFSSAESVDLPPEKRRLGMMFQTYALWPHMSVFDNVAYPLRARRTPRPEVERRVQHVLDLVGISELRRQYSGQMSGGQQQRVALARALVSNEGLILFDEPLSNVDAKVRELLRREIIKMQQEIGFTAIYVTHDQTEAMEMADRIAVMERGRIAQIGAPREIYERPVSRYVGRFIGTTNELAGRVTQIVDSETVRVATDLGDVFAARGDDGVKVGAEVVMLARPESCRLEPRSDTADDTVNTWDVTVTKSMFLGMHTEHLVRLQGRRSTSSCARIRTEGCGRLETACAFASDAATCER
ncbi:ABC transporter ATP-binding protein [Microbacterium sp. NIBRBAC000506063]|nr:ABC transporter ATP-binding protein [Microbacterium sp. NIBRBAC000506063]